MHIVGGNLKKNCLYDIGLDQMTCFQFILDYYKPTILKIDPLLNIQQC